MHYNIDPNDQYRNGHIVVTNLTTKRYGGTQIRNALSEGSGCIKHCV